MAKLKRKGKKRIIVSCVLVGLFIIVCFLGWFAPIGTMTPIFLMMSRPEIVSCSKNLMIGNFGAYFHTPWTLNLLQPAWNSEQMVYGMTALCDQAKEGKTVYYDVYSQAEQKANKEKEQVGLYCLHSASQEKRPYVIMIAGGGFSSVCTPMESLPVCASFNEMGYTCFALTYRISGNYGTPQEQSVILEDVSSAISFITDNADELNVDPNNYLIGGFSAGGHVVSTWCNEDTGYNAYDLPAPAAACFIYGMNMEDTDAVSLPVFARYCVDDPYFEEAEFDAFVNAVSQKGYAVNYQKVECLHGFGLGLGTPAEGWTAQAETFWHTVRTA